MTYTRSQTVVKNYNIMGVAKAALESAVRYIAAELGPKGWTAKKQAPACSLVSIDNVGIATAFLGHDAARLITGEALYVDGAITSSI